ncbi:MAG: type II toxin-antitoxin system PemK/MazF family toxin [Solirubrobacteraceae bacterium]
MSLASPGQGEIWLGDLDPTVGDEIRKRRPVLVVSRDEINRVDDPGRRVVIVVPLTTTPTAGAVATRIPEHDGDPARASYIVPWQVRAVSRRRLVTRIASVDRETLEQVVLRVKLLVSVPDDR